MILAKIKKVLFGNKKTSLKKDIRINQRGSSLFLEGELRNPFYKVEELWFMSRNEERLFKVQSNNKSATFNFEINLKQYPDLYDGVDDIYNLYLFVTVPKTKLSPKKLNKLENKETTVYNEQSDEVKFPIRLGRFDKTVTLHQDFLTIDGNKVMLYKTTKGNISLSVNHDLTPHITTQIDNMRLRKNNIKLNGKIYTKNSLINSLHLVLKGRENNIETKIPVYPVLLPETENRYGLNRYKYIVDIDLNKMFNHDYINEDIYDLYFEADYHDIDQLVRGRLGRPRFIARFNIKSAFTKKEHDTYVVSPYFTIKYRNLSFQVDKFENNTYTYMRRLMRWYWLLRFFHKKKDIWVIGERPYKAQDTGFHFFKYMRENHPERNAYYVIEKDSPELSNIKEYGNILYFKSKEHIFHTLMATRVIGSHHPDYLYPLRTDEFKKKVKAIKVFLQHGVMGTKNTVHFYGKDSPSFHTDLFMVSSDFEKSMIVNDFGYHPNEVKVTGLSRFDSLLKKDIDIKRQLLIIPTWREWLVNEDQFLESEYFSRYNSLVNNSKLHQLAKDQNFEIVFCLHPNMQQFTHLFKDSPVRVVSQGEIDVQYLLKESSMMITDYSSVAFDFSFLEKPILYYQFDRKRFIGKKGSHIDLDEDLPGDIVYDEETILEKVHHYATNNFTMSERNQIRATKFLKYKDLNSSERIYKATKEARMKPFYKRILENEYSYAFFRRFRKSKYYFPVMKKYYNLAKKFVKVDKNMILFESGLGKQYADSPRYIYEEILRRNLDYKTVWVCNKNIKFKDPETIRVTRLSPKYYYYLAKSGYWVNNQNFPTYIKKRKETTYVQTWHGTPLKKMLFDIENIMGRSDDYLERVYNATKTWDYLISPSSYATNSFKSAFKYEGEVLEIGYPRNDLFYKDYADELKKDVKQKLSIPEDKKVILYAPTFRDNQTSSNNKFLFDIHMDLYQMKEKLGDEYVILLRMHVVISNKIKIAPELKEFVKNVSNYDEIQELYLISDILITDYSSVMFDFANTKRPILYYTFDLETYRDDIRGFYFDFEQEAPGPFIRTTEEIIETVTNIEDVKVKYQEKYNHFYDKFCGLEDGNASARLVDKVFEK